MLWLVLGLVLLGTVAGIYILNPTIQTVKIGNETIKIGVKDAINLLINAMKPLPEMKHNYSCFPYYDKVILLNGTKIYGIPREFYKLMGDTIEVCYKNCCINVTLKNKILINIKPANKTIYIKDKEILNEIINLLEKENYNGALKIIIKGIIDGKIKGVTIEDIKRIAGL